MKRKEDKKFIDIDIIPAGFNETSFILSELLILKKYRYKGLLKIVANVHVIYFSIKRLLEDYGLYIRYLSFSLDKRFIILLSKEIGSGIYKPNLNRKLLVSLFSKNNMDSINIMLFVDEIVQEAMFYILQLIYEPLFSDFSHGFRPKRDCHTAISQYKKQFINVSWILNFDIQKCFDFVDHNILANLLFDNINDKGFIDLYWKMVKAGYIFLGTHYLVCKDKNLRYSRISSIFLNIYLDKLDKFIENCKFNFTNGIDLINTVKLKNFKDFFYIRYGDKFIIGLNCSLSIAKIFLKNINEFIFFNFKLCLDNNKVFNFKHDYINFLGFVIKGYCLNNKTNSVVNGKISFTIFPQVFLPVDMIFKKLVQKGFAKYNNNNIKSISLRWLVSYSLFDILLFYNFIYLSIASYYSICGSSSFSVLRAIYYKLKISCVLTIALKMKLKKIYKVLKIYGSNLSINKISFIRWDFFKIKPKNTVYFIYDPFNFIIELTFFGIYNNLNSNIICKLCNSKHALSFYINVVNENINENIFLKKILFCRQCYYRINKLYFHI